MGPNLSAYMRCDYAQKALCFLLLFACLVHHPVHSTLLLVGLAPAMALPLLQNISVLEAQAFTLGGLCLLE